MAGQHAKKAEDAMARTQLKRKPKPALKSASRRRRQSVAARPAKKKQRQHKFLVHHSRPEHFKTDGLRNYAAYRDLGVKDATRGMVVAHVIRFVEPCDPKIVSKQHLH